VFVQHVAGTQLSNAIDFAYKTIL